MGLTLFCVARRLPGADGACRATILAAAGLAFLFAAAPAPAYYIEIEYVGVGTVHLTYAFSPPLGVDSVRLECHYPDGSVQTLASQQGEGRFEGEVQQLALAAGEHRYEIWVTYVPQNGDPYDEHLATEVTNVNGTVRGELKWSDIVDGENPEFPNISVGEVDVPAGLTLDFQKVDLSQTPYLYVVGPGLNATGHALRLEAADAVGFDECVLDEVNVYGCNPTFSNCFFRSPLYAIEIRTGAPWFLDCDIRGDVEMVNRNSAHFIGNVFLGEVVFRNSGGEGDPWSDSGDEPNLTGNSFLGRKALRYAGGAPPSAPISIGTNYYGDPSGWRAYDAEDVFLQSRGAHVEGADAFDIASPQTSGRARADAAYPPEVWLHASIHGQTSIPHTGTSYTRRGRSLLVSADIVADDLEVRGARIYGKWNGQTIQPTRPDAALHRDRRGGGGAREIREGMTTVNFLIPNADQETNTFEIRADLSGLTSHEPGEETLLASPQIRTSGPPGRDFNVLIWPIRIYLPGYRRTVPNGKAFRKRFMELAPTWLPLEKNEIHSWTGAYMNYWAPWGVLTTLALINDLSAKLEIERRALNLIMDEPIDFIVVPLEKGALNGVLTGQSVDGVSLALRRGVVLVDESMPDASFHEMGHGIGLYTDDEQYDLHPDFGLPNQACTSFVTPANSPLKKMFGDAGRVTHHAASDADWRNPDLEWFDIMGNGLRTQWPMPATYHAFLSWMYANLQADGAGARAVAGATGRDPVEDGEMRLFIHGRVETVEQDGETTYRLRQGTVRALNVSDVSLRPLYQETEGVARCVVQAYHGSSVSSYTVWMGPEAFTLSLDVPDDTYRLKVLDYSLTETLLELGVQGVGSRAISPAPGSTVAEQTPVEWTAWTGPAPSFPASRAGETASQPVQNLIMVSPDGGAHWMVAGLREDFDFTLDPDVYASSNSLSVRILSSTGLRSSLCRIDNLSVPERPPRVEIDAPADGVSGDTNTSWTLRALAYDPDDGPLANGQWTSSLDGDLGSDETIEEVRLSQGTHTLTYRVEDTGGLAGEASVAVSVLETGRIDLALGPDALWLTPADGSSGAATDPLTIGSTYTAALVFTNGGVGTTVALALGRTPAGGSETPVASATQYLAPFAPLVVGGAFVLESAGELTLRGVATATDVSDAAPENNEATWTYTTVAGPRPFLAPTALDFGDLERQGAEGTAEVAIANTGDTAFAFQGLTIESDATGAFRIVAAPAPGESVPPGGQLLATVACAPLAAGPHTAELVATTDATATPELRGALYGRLTDYYDASEALEYLLGLTSDPTGLDRNGDGRVTIGDALIP